MSRLYLADKSAYEQRRHSLSVEDLFNSLIESKTLAACEIVALEILYSARNLAEYDRVQNDLEALTWLDVDVRALRRAREVQHKLARQGQHRLPLPDLIIAATAERHGAVVLHYDKDFDLIAAVTGQPTQWVVAHN
ncbi:MAG: PIN domain nuclease [Candidatus Dormibacteraceae bacterium]